MIETNLPTLVYPIAAQRKFMITLNLREDRSVQVRSCEVTASAFRNRTSFIKDTGLPEIFVPGLAQAVQHCLDKLRLRTEVLALPQFLLELPGLTLHGVQIMATKLEDQTVNVIMRFNHFMGSIGSALAVPIGFDAAVPEEQQIIATQVLEDITAPLLNICTSAALGLKGTNEKLGAFGRQIASLSHEISFRMTLLRRFIEDNETADRRVLAPITDRREFHGGGSGRLPDARRDKDC